MEYTWKAYKNLIDIIKNNGYVFTDYFKYHNYNKVCIMRHDIDFDIEKAVKMSDYEKEFGITAIYFVLCDSPLYNILSSDNVNNLKHIIANGSEIGLHFDASTINTYDELELKVLKYKNIIESNILDGTDKKELKVMSYHIPNEKSLNFDKEIISGLVNVYSKKYFVEFKYISDSGHRWRENPEEIIKNGKNYKIQCLTHPIWYLDKNSDTKFFYEQIIDNKSKRKKYLIDNFKCFKNIER